MKTFTFSGAISVEKCQQYYRGETKYVIFTADTGERVQMAFRHFHPFISQLGIRGRFRLILTDNGDFFSLEKIS